MNISITGSLGNIGRRLTRNLIEKGHRVTVVSHSPERVKDIERLGALAVIGSLEDTGLLLRAFDKADAVFTMVPPNYAATDLREYIRRSGEGYARAIKATGIRHVVNLSSIGAHIPDGPGPTGANHYVEQQLNALEGVHVLHLRPGMFYTNFFGAIPLIRYRKIIGNNFEASVKMALSHPKDIADIAADALDTRYFTGSNIRYVAGDEKNGGEIASALGQAIGLPDLAWVGFSDEEMLQAMLQNGLSREMATVYVLEIGVALRDGTLLEDYRLHKGHASAKTGLREFAEEFSVVYRDSQG